MRSARVSEETSGGLDEVSLAEGTTSIASSPVAAQLVSPVAGWVQRVFASCSGTTTGTISVSVSINGGSDITGGNLTIPAGTGSRNNAVYELVGTASSSSVFVNEGDNIVFTPSGGTGASVGGAFTIVIRLA
jgi:hypothetical protein